MNIKEYLKNAAGSALKKNLLATAVILAVIFFKIDAASSQTGTRTNSIGKKPAAAKVIPKKKKAKSAKVIPKKKKAKSAKVIPKKKKAKSAKVIPKKKKAKSAKTAKAAKATTAKTSLKWTPDGFRALGSIASFGYNYSLRNTIIKKVENYARRKNIRVITAKVVNSMDE